MNVKNIAMVAHQINKAFCESVGDTSQVNWNEAPDNIKQSAIDGVIFHLENDAEPKDIHDNWMRFKVKDGWTYGEVKDFEKKTHPCLVEYEKLAPEQRSKDYIFKAVVDSLKSL